MIDLIMTRGFPQELQSVGIVHKKCESCHRVGKINVAEATRPRMLQFPECFESRLTSTSSWFTKREVHG